MKCKMTRTLLLAASLLVPATSSLAELLSVPSQEYPTIQTAINASEDGDLIEIRDGGYVETLTMLGKTITLTASPGGHAQVFSPNGRHVIEPRDDIGLGGTVTFYSMSFHGHAPGNPVEAPQPGDDEGFRIDNWNVSFNDCNFINLVSWYDEDVLLYGGAVELYRCHAEFNNCRIEGNGVISTKPNFSSIARGGAIHASYSTVLLENNLIRYNYVKAARNRAAQNSYSAGALGGAVWASNSDLVIDGGSFRGNMATRVDGRPLPEIARGGAIYLEDSTKTLLERVTFDDNTSKGLGGAMYCTQSKGSAMGYLKNCLFRNNHGEHGGGAYAGDARAKSANSTYECNTVTQVEGGFIDSFGNRFFECPRPRDPADLNNDGVVDKHDIMLIYYNWGKAKPGSMYDLNQDNRVDSKDVVEVLKAMDPKK